MKQSDEIDNKLFIEEDDLRLFIVVSDFYF